MQEVQAVLTMLYRFGGTICRKSMAFLCLALAVGATAFDARSLATLSPVQIGEMAKKFTVKIGGRESGSGSIVRRSGDLYTVLTNWHVVDSEGQYNIQTEDGSAHVVTRKIRLEEADLAVLYFTSPKDYRVARAGNSERLSEGQTIHFAGYPSPQKVARNRIYQFYPSEKIVGFLAPADVRDGYRIVFTGAALPGMSGGPILDNNGNLIGIYGRSETNDNTLQSSLYGIPLVTALRLAQQAGLSLLDSESVRETPPASSLPEENSGRPSRPSVIVPETRPLAPICPGARC